MRIGVTGASGQLGTATVRELASRVPASNIVAITRTPGKLEQFLTQGIDVRAGDFDDPAGLANAFACVERLLIIPASDLRPDIRPRQHRAAIDAAKAAGVGHVTYVSTVGARPGKSDGILETHFGTEQALISSGVAWTLLRMSVYADMLIDSAKRAIASGSYSALDGAPAAYVLRDDLAAAAAGLLATDGHEGITYHATGLVSVTATQVAAIISKLSGTNVGFSPITIEQFEGGLTAAGLPQAIVKVISRFQAALRDGAFDLVTGDIERLSGRRPETLENFLARGLRSSAKEAHA